MNILITGGAGFIGSHLADALITAGHRVTIIDNLSTGTKEFINPEAEFIEADIRDRDALSFFKTHHFDVIYHEAAQTMVPESIKDPHFDADENIMGLLSILEAARDNEVRKIIFSSSAYIFLRPYQMDDRTLSGPVPHSLRLRLHHSSLQQRLRPASRRSR